MTLLKPTLKVNRLTVYQNQHVAFDCLFHSGVNVIRGRNSSGKTTVMDLLAFALGSENIRWKPEALWCTQTLVEVELNGRKVCLLREVSSESQRPMRIYWGKYEDLTNVKAQDWQQYSFRRTDHQVSFSQAVFTALEMPIAQGEGASNLTLHQVMRVLYADQPSIHSPIFRDDIFDKALTRETVGSYLSGAYDDRLYSAQLRLREITTLFSGYEAELRGIFAVLGQSGQTPDLVTSGAQIRELEAEQDAIARQIVDIKQRGALPRKDANKARLRADSLRAELNAARRDETSLKERLDSIELDLSDTQLFIRELENRLSSLDESKETRSYFGRMQFHFCPSCLSELDLNDNDPTHCNLCSSLLSDGRGESQLLRMRNELSIQLRESSLIAEEHSQTAETLRREIPSLVEKIKSLEREYSVVASSWSSGVEVKLEELTRRLGGLGEEIKQAYERQKLASVISDLQTRRDNANAEILQLNDLINSLKKGQEARQQEVHDVIEAALIRLLKEDIPLQPEFVDPKSIVVSFANNAVWVNGSKNFSESSAVVLRHLFHLALLTASMKLQYMRMPRFLMLDGIDDGGMEKGRSHRLQRIIIDECARYEFDYQVIYATSEINPDLENSELVVGRFFTPTARSLDVRAI
ncbi:AAA family ATPase [Variovorax sp. tm]|uniref:AAA family ATPase n=1 Tax=Variovorax atrisoli TaxID=3394203 RepID=UPI003A7FDDD0